MDIRNGPGCDAGPTVLLRRRRSRPVGYQQAKDDDVGERAVEPGRLAQGALADEAGPQRLVPLAVVAERAEASPRVRKTAERRLAYEAQLELLRDRIDRLELRLADLERRLEAQGTGPPA